MNQKQRELLDEAISAFKWLRENPNMACISHDGLRMYMRVDREIIVAVGPNWNDMTEEEINAFILQRRRDYYASHPGTHPN